MAFEEPLSSSFEEESTTVRGRRAAVLGGVALVWAAFMAALGLVLIGLLVLVAAGIAAAWILGLRVPRHDVHSAARRGGRRVRAGGVATARVAGIASRHSLAAGRTLAASTSRGLSAAGRGAADRVSGAPALASRAIERGSEAVNASRSRLSRRRDPRIEEALASNSEGIALAKAGKPAEAIDAFDTALALLAETDDRHHEGQVLANLGVVHHQVGGDEAARFCWTKALERLEPGTRESERTAELLSVR